MTSTRNTISYATWKNRKKKWKHRETNQKAKSRKQENMNILFLSSATSSFSAKHIYNMIHFIWTSFFPFFFLSLLCLFSFREQQIFSSFYSHPHKTSLHSILNIAINFFTIPLKSHALIFFYFNLWTYENSRTFFAFRRILSFLLNICMYHCWTLGGRCLALVTFFT